MVLEIQRLGVGISLTLGKASWYTGRVHMKDKVGRQERRRRARIALTTTLMWKIIQRSQENYPNSFQEHAPTDPRTFSRSITSPLPHWGQDSNVDTWRTNHIQTTAPSYVSAERGPDLDAYGMVFFLPGSFYTYFSVLPAPVLLLQIGLIFRTRGVARNFPTCILNSSYEMWQEKIVDALYFLN